MLRIGSNYARLLTTFILGIAIVRILVGLGSDVFSVYALVTIGLGVGTMLKELLRLGLVPELGREFNDGLPNEVGFRVAYASSFVVALGFAVSGALIMIVFGQ